jgi:hypothetical protein
MLIGMLTALALAAAPLPQAERLPQPDFADKEVLAAVEALLATLETGDAPALLRLVYPEGRVTGRGTFAGGASGLRSRSFTEYAARMTPGSGFIERITHPVIEQDGDVALVWAPFTILMGGKLVSCGYDHFDLVRENGAWKVMNLTFSSRTEGCGA